MKREEEKREGEKRSEEKVIKKLNRMEMDTRRVEKSREE